MSVSEDQFAKSLSESITGFSISFLLLSEALIEKGSLDRERLIELLNRGVDQICQISPYGLEKTVLQSVLNALKGSWDSKEITNRPDWFRGVIDGSRVSPSGSHSQSPDERED